MAADERERERVPYSLSAIKQFLLGLAMRWLLTRERERERNLAKF